MVTCPVCGTNLTDDAAFCSVCGTALKMQSQTPMQQSAAFDQAAYSAAPQQSHVQQPDQVAAYGQAVPQQPQQQVGAVPYAAPQPYAPAPAPAAMPQSYGAPAPAAMPQAYGAPAPATMPQAAPAPTPAKPKRKMGKGGIIGIVVGVVAVAVVVLFLVFGSGLLGGVQVVTKDSTVSQFANQSNPSDTQTYEFEVDGAGNRTKATYSTNNMVSGYVYYNFDQNGYVTSVEATDANSNERFTIMDFYNTVDEKGRLTRSIVEFDNPDGVMFEANVTYTYYGDSDNCATISYDFTGDSGNDSAMYFSYVIQMSVFAPSQISKGNLLSALGYYVNLGTRKAVTTFSEEGLVQTQTIDGEIVLNESSTTLDARRNQTKRVENGSYSQETTYDAQGYATKYHSVQSDQGYVSDTTIEYKTIAMPSKAVKIFDRLR